MEDPIVDSTPPTLGKGKRARLYLNADGTLRVTPEGGTAPTGGATAAKQDTGNTLLASIDTKTPALGQALAAASSPVVLTAIQVSALSAPAATIANGADVAEGATTDAPVADNTTVASATPATVIGSLKRLVNLFIAILAKLPALGTAGTASANVITVQGIASGTPQTVTPVTQTVAVALLGASASQVIPAGAKGWSYAIITGTATVAGTALIPAGVGDSDPGTLAATLTITTAAASSAYVRWGT